MAEVVKMPKLSDTMTDGVIAKWHKKVGDKVKSGELLAEIETDKATMDFESFQDGVLLYIGVQEKEAVPVDSLIAILGKEGEDISDLVKGGAQGAKEESPEAERSSLQDKEAEGSPEAEQSSLQGQEKAEGSPEAEHSSLQGQQEAGGSKQKADGSEKKTAIPEGVEIVRMPKLSDTMTDGVVAKWHKKVGDKVKSGELLADIETDKATMEFESFQDGVLIYQGIEEGKSAPVDSILAILGKGGEDVKAILASAGKEEKAPEQKDSKETPKKDKGEESKSSDKKQESKEEGGGSSEEHGDRIKASPLARALAKEKGIDLSKVKGSAENGRITKADIENYKPSSASQSGVAVGTESYKDEPVSQMRKTIARRLLESKNGAPHFYLNIEVDMDNAIASRNAINTIPDTKISFNDFVIKACAAALRRHPKVNASWMGDKIRYFSHIHIGVAVAIEDGLLVPVIRFADQKSLSQIGGEVKDLAKRAHDKKLQPADWEGNTFTVSNLGMFGIESFTSIINSPESCILSVGAIRQIPVVKNNMVVPGNVMKLTLACDHRTVDGATGAAFLQTLKLFIENPVTMLV